MLEEYKLDILEVKTQAALQKELDAWKKYTDERNLASSAYDDMETAQLDLYAAKKKMDDEFEFLQMTSTLHREIWEQFAQVRDSNKSRMELLHFEAELENLEMQKCLNQANIEFVRGDKVKAADYAERARRHKERHKSLSKQIQELRREVYDAEANAKLFAPRINAKKYREARRVFNKTKTICETAQLKFNCFKNERDQLKEEYEIVQKEHTRLKDEFQRKLKEASC